MMIDVTLVALMWTLALFVTCSAVTLALFNAGVRKKENDDQLCELCEEFIPMWQTLLLHTPDRGMGWIGLKACLILSVLGPLGIVVGLVVYHCPCEEETES